jgi:hypothetical protein
MLLGGAHARFSAIVLRDPIPHSLGYLRQLSFAKSSLMEVAIKDLRKWCSVGFIMRSPEWTSSLYASDGPPESTEIQLDVLVKNTNPLVVYTETSLFRRS